MNYNQTSPLDARYHEHDVESSDSIDEGMSSDRIHWLRPGTMRRSAFKNDRFASGGPSTVRRTFRGFARFFFAILIGVAATLGWQSYGDEAKEIVRTWDPSLDWLLPSVAKLPPPITSAEVQQQLKPMAVDIVLLRRSVEQFAANLDQLARKEEQMAQNVATMQAAEQQLILKLSSPAPAKPAHAPPPPAAPRPAQ